MNQDQHSKEQTAAKAFGAPALTKAITQIPPPELQAVSESLVTAPELSAPAPQPTESVSAIAASDSAVEPPSTSQPVVNLEANESQRPIQKHMNRCFACNKRVGLTGFKCRCDYVFCGAHRLPEEHHCDFDYKTAGREQLSKNNPLVVPSKLNKV